MRLFIALQYQVSPELTTLLPHVDGWSSKKELTNKINHLLLNREGFPQKKEKWETWGTRVFTRGPPPHYWLGPTMFDCADRTGCGKLIVVWPQMKGHHEVRIYRDWTVQIANYLFTIRSQIPDKLWWVFLCSNKCSGVNSMILSKCQPFPAHVEPASLIRVMYAFITTVIHPEVGKFTEACIFDKLRLYWMDPPWSWPLIIFIGPTLKLGAKVQSKVPKVPRNAKPRAI